jgi:hypothetical protein
VRSMKPSRNHKVSQAGMVMTDRQSQLQEKYTQALNPIWGFSDSDSCMAGLHLKGCNQVAI